MAHAVRAIRGATTLDEDTEAQMTERVEALVSAMLERNAVHHDDIISVIFTATEDLVCSFPAAAARKAGLGDIPLLCAREISVTGGTPRCVRVLMHVSTEQARSDLHHVYLEGASGLRDDLPD